MRFKINDDGEGEKRRETEFERYKGAARQSKKGEREGRVAPLQRGTPTATIQKSRAPPPFLRSLFGHLTICIFFFFTFYIASPAPRRAQGTAPRHREKDREREREIGKKKSERYNSSNTNQLNGERGDRITLKTTITKRHDNKRKKNYCTNRKRGGEE